MIHDFSQLGPDVSGHILSELPVSVLIADVTGNVLFANGRARAVLGPQKEASRLSSLADWHPRNGSLSTTLRLIAGSSNWLPVGLWRDDDHVLLKGRGFLMDSHSEPHVLLTESLSAPRRFTEHSEQVRRLNAQLLVQRQTEDRLRTALRTTEALRRELVHRVKNSLAIVSALLRNKAREAEHPSVNEAMASAAARIQSIAIVHDVLDSLSETEFLSSQALFHALLAHLRASICPPNVSLESDVFETQLHADTALPLSLLVNELVTNAIKHAFVGKESGTVTVTFAPADEGFVLTVADNGSGLDETSARKGNGSRIIDALARQIGGQVAVCGKAGTTWTITNCPNPRRELAT